MNSELLKDLQDFIGQERDRIRGNKALRVQVKCLLRGKIELARKIEDKYKRHFPKSDLAMATGMLLEAAAIQKFK